MLRSLLSRAVPQLHELLSSMPCLSDETLFLWESIINIVIVYLGGRNACLIESGNYYPEKDFDSDWRILKRLCRRLGLVITKDRLGLPDHPRYLISKTRIRAPTSDEALGRLLGMTWTGVYYDYKTPRTSMTIYALTPDNNRIDLFTQVVVGRSIVRHRQAIQTMCDQWQQLWDLHTGSFASLRFQTESSYDAGTLRRAQSLLQKSIQQQYKKDIINDIDNFCPEKMDVIDQWLKTQSGRKRIHQLYTTHINIEE